MKSKVRIYKILDETPSIYVETNEMPTPFDLELYLDTTLVDSVCDKNTHHVFSVTKPGVYSVAAKHRESPPLNSNSLSFFNADFQPGVSFKSLVDIGAAQFSANEPELDFTNEYHVEIKTRQDKAKDIKRILDSTFELNSFQKIEFNLNSFQTTHSIHNYEYYRTSKPLSKEDALDACRKLEDINGVVYCSIVPVTDNVLPPELNTKEKSKKVINGSPDTPDFSGLQGYLDEPHGMNIRNVWSSGYSGESAVIRHLDFGIYKNHEDFQGGNITVINSRNETNDCNHGTASTGCIAAAKNGFGVTGIAHSSSFYFYDTGDKDKILEQSNPGDIVSMNIQFSSNNVLIPAIGIKSWWDTIRNLTEKGAIVIIAAGNSGADLSDTSICPDYGDSGAMLVGACSSSTGRKLSFSNYGHYSSLINSWGENVITTGYSSLQDLPGHDRDYTNTYAGTSSATPLCSGALALLQSYAKKHGVILTAKSMKKLLSESSYTEGADDLIGKRPNIEQLLTRIDNLALSPINQKNPFPVSSSYINHNAFFSSDSDSEVRINFDYKFSDIKNAGIVTYYDSEGPTNLEWFSYGYSHVKIPVSDMNDQTSIIYMRVSKVISGYHFTMNSSADMKDLSPGKFDLVLKFMTEDNKHLLKNKYKGILPLYIKSSNFKDYNLPVRLNIFVG
jgi:subtilisin family serine protease